MTDIRRITGDVTLSRSIYHHFGGMKQLHDEFGLPYQKTTSRKSFVDKCNVKLTAELSEYLDGLLLGDGSLVYCKTDNTGRYTQSFAVRYQEWADKILTDLKQFGISCRVSERDHHGYSNISRCIDLQSRSYPCLTSVRERWYPDGVKIVPSDLKLTPNIMANWFMGDGSTSWTIPCSYQNTILTLCTNGFNKTDVEVLISMLRNIDIDARSSKAKNGWTIVVRNRDSIKNLLDMCSELKVSCFDYKWKYPYKVREKKIKNGNESLWRWDNFINEVKPYLIDGKLPSDRVLRELGRNDIENAVRLAYGGKSMVNQRMKECA